MYLYTDTDMNAYTQIDRYTYLLLVLFLSWTPDCYPYVHTYN